MKARTIVGVWKLLGAAAIVVPGVPCVKEWAYASAGQVNLREATFV